MLSRAPSGPRLARLASSNRALPAPLLGPPSRSISTICKLWTKRYKGPHLDQRAVAARSSQLAKRRRAAGWISADRSSASSRKARPPSSPRVSESESRYAGISAHSPDHLGGDLEMELDPVCALAAAEGLIRGEAGGCKPHRPRGKLEGVAVPLQRNQAARRSLRTAGRRAPRRSARPEAGRPRPARANRPGPPATRRGAGRRGRHRERDGPPRPHREPVAFPGPASRAPRRRPPPSARPSPAPRRTRASREAPHPRPAPRRPPRPPARQSPRRRRPGARRRCAGGRVFASARKPVSSPRSRFGLFAPVSGIRPFVTCVTSPVLASIWTWARGTRSPSLLV